MAEPSDYDQLPYPHQAYAQTHPDRLASVARLLGFAPAPVTTARVLELGCASGGNLIPMAEQLPRARFVGVDRSRQQITEAQTRASAIGLQNLELLHLDLVEAGRSLGEFDYIICHGLYSWIAPAVQAELLRLCGAHLAPQGLALVSFNALPGWYLGLATRDLMRLHAEGSRSPREQAERGVAAVAALARAGGDDAFHLSFRERADELSQFPLGYTFHDYLEQEQRPVYLREFLAAAGQHGLRHLADADLTLRPPAPLPPEFEAASAGDWQRQEQYRDFVEGRRFRQSILRRGADAPPPPLQARHLRTLHLACELRAPEDAAGQLASLEAVTFAGEGHFRFVSNDPYLKTALALLGEAWPGEVPFERLWPAIRERLGARGAPSAATEERFLRLLLEAVLQRAISVRTYPRGLEAQVPERPRTSRAVRHALSLGESRVTNLLHRHLALTEPERRLLLCCDGTRELPSLRQALPDLPAEAIDAALQELVRKALLAGKAMP